MKNYDWIIGICNTDADGVSIYRFRGTKNEAKEKLIQMINEDRNNDAESWEHGNEDSSEIRETKVGSGYELYGYGCYSSYHIDYTAIESAAVEEV